MCLMSRDGREGWRMTFFWEMDVWLMTGYGVRLLFSVKGGSDGWLS